MKNAILCPICFTYIYIYIYVGFEVHTAVTVKRIIFWVDAMYPGRHSLMFQKNVLHSSSGLKGEPSNQ
jgi:hypothetical protein